MKRKTFRKPKTRMLRSSKRWWPWLPIRTVWFVLTTTSAGVAKNASTWCASPTVSCPYAKESLICDHDLSLGFQPAVEDSFQSIIDPIPIDPTRECFKDEDCGSEREKCSDGRCTDKGAYNCQSNHDCKEREVCVPGIWVCFPKWRRML